MFVAKTTMPDYGMLSSGLSSFHALARNPWDLSQNPGGSSAGAGAAAAAGYGPLHIGTDIGGSIRLPAGWCGIFGLKPSLGRMPIEPPYAGRAAGPMTRTVADAALMMGVLSAPDARDAMSLPPQPIDWLDLDARASRGLRIGLLLDAGWGLAARRRGARRRRGGGARLRGAPAPSSSRCAPFMTRAMADGIDRFWRMRSWLDMSALPEARRARVLPFIRDWAAAAPSCERRAGVPRLAASCTPCARPPSRPRSAFDFVLSPVSPVTGFPAEWPAPTNDRGALAGAHRLHRAVQHERAARGVDELRLHRARHADRPADHRPALRRPRRAAAGARLGAAAAGAKGLARRARIEQAPRNHTMRDHRGLPVSTTSQPALDAAEKALWRMVSFYGDPLADIDAAAQADSGWILPPLMRGAFLLGVTEPAWVGDARSAVAQAEPLAARSTERERAHLAALRACAEGRWQRAGALWDAILVEHPRDLLALANAHLFDFYRGDALNLRQRVARVLPEWPRDDALQPYVLGMHAFGLEECNFHPQAEAAGRAALDADARGPWAIHAVAHVMEMQGRHDEGTSWLDGRRDQWSIDNGFACTCGGTRRCFASSDSTMRERSRSTTRISATRPAQSIHLLRLDAVALLWRLHLLGIDGDERWRSLAARYAGWSEDVGYYAFNDLFALLAFVGAGDFGQARALLAESERRAGTNDAGGDNQAMAREVGLPLMRGLIDFAEGRHDAAVEALQPVRAIAHRFGGSHAQRDLIDQTLLAACASGSPASLARARAAQRAAPRQAGDGADGALGRPARRWLNRRPSRCRPT